MHAFIKCLTGIVGEATIAAEEERTRVEEIESTKHRTQVVRPV